MSKTDTKYLIVDGSGPGLKCATEIAALLDDHYTLISSWVAGNRVHHLLSKVLETTE